MAERVQFTLPDIGDFHDVDVVEVLVSVGQRVEKEQSLIVLESDKATMEIPSPVAGVIEALRVGVGDQVNEGDPIVMTNDEVLALAREFPEATVVAIHFETVSHSTETRAELRARTGALRILVPEDGAEIPL